MSRLSEHTDKTTLKEFVRGDLANEAVTRVVCRHLAICSECRERAESLFREHSAGPSSLTGARNGWQGPPLAEVIPQAARSHAAQLSKEREQAPALLEQLREQPLARQLLLIRNAERFRNWGLVEALVSESEELLARDPGLSRDLAEAGMAAGLLLSAERYGAALLADLHLRVSSRLGAACLACNDHVAAERAFEEARAYLRRGTGDPRERCEFLRRDAEFAVLAKEDFGRAMSQLDEALAISERCGALDEQLCVLSDRARLEATHDQAEAEREVLQRAVRLCRQHGVEDHRYAGFVGRQLHLLVRTARWEEAQQCASELENHLKKEGRQDNPFALRDDLLVLRRTQGWIALQTDQRGFAKRALLEARNGYVAVGDGQAAAEVTLELAMVYLSREGCSEAQPMEIRVLASQLPPILRSDRLPSEVLAAMTLFKEAAEAGSVTRIFAEDMHQLLLRRRATTD